MSSEYSSAHPSKWRNQRMRGTPLLSEKGSKVEESVEPSAVKYAEAKLLVNVVLGTSGTFPSQKLVSHL